MKKTMIYFRTVTMAVIALLTIGFTQSVHAAAPIAVTELKFVGQFNSAPVFQLELNNTSNAQYLIIVRDSEKKVLLTEKLAGENLSRRYKLQAEELELVAGTTFEIINKNTNEITTYEVSSSSSFVTDVLISKL